MQIETPFPVEGTVKATDYGHSSKLPCASEWLTETESGTNYLQAAVDRVARKYGEGVEARVRFTSDSFGDGCGGYTILGRSDEIDVYECPECGETAAASDDDGEPICSQCYVEYPAEAVEAADE
jgi:hypothetical protein